MMPQNSTEAAALGKGCTLAKWRSALMAGIAVTELAASSAMAQVVGADETWQGESNVSGGEVEYGYTLKPDDPSFNPEFAESMPLRIRCTGCDGSVTVESPHDVPADFNAGTEVRVEVDGVCRQYASSISYIGGDYTAVPLLQVLKGDPLLSALMSGSSAKIYVDGRELLNMHLRGTRETISHHLRACL